MIEKIAGLYAQRSLNERLYTQGMITEGMYRIAQEGIAMDIDRFEKKAFANDGVCSDRGMSDGIARHPAVAR